MFGGSGFGYQGTTTGIPTGRAGCSAAIPRSGMTAARMTICWVPELRRPRAVTALPLPPATRVRHWQATLQANTCNPDFNVSQLGVITRWTPVKNLTFSGEVQWFPSRSEDVGLFGVYGECSEADGAL
jgi:hypothetical protein